MTAGGEQAARTLTAGFGPQRPVTSGCFPESAKGDTSPYLTRAAEE